MKPLGSTTALLTAQTTEPPTWPGAEVALRVTRVAGGALAGDESPGVDAGVTAVEANCFTWAGESGPTPSDEQALTATAARPSAATVRRSRPWCCAMHV